MKYFYPVIITKSNDEYVAYIPDFDINTEAKTVAGVIDMAREAIGLCGISYRDMGRAVPKPRTLKPECGADDLLALVDIDFALFRESEETREEDAIKSEYDFSNAKKNPYKTKLK